MQYDYLMQYHWLVQYDYLVQYYFSVQYSYLVQHDYLVQCIYLAQYGYLVHSRSWRTKQWWNVIVEFKFYCSRLMSSSKRKMTIRRKVKFFFLFSKTEPFLSCYSEGVKCIGFIWKEHAIAYMQASVITLLWLVFAYRDECINQLYNLITQIFCQYLCAGISPIHNEYNDVNTLYSPTDVTCSGGLTLSGPNCSYEWISMHGRWTQTIHGDLLKTTDFTRGHEWYNCTMYCKIRGKVYPIMVRAIHCQFDVIMFSGRRFNFLLLLQGKAFK